MTDQRATAQQAFAALRPKLQKAHQAKWNAIADYVAARMPKHSRVFELHYKLEHARSCYFGSLSEGLPPDECFARAMKLVK